MTNDRAGATEQLQRTAVAPYFETARQKLAALEKEMEELRQKQKRIDAEIKHLRFWFDSQQTLK